MKNLILVLISTFSLLMCTKKQEAQNQRIYKGYYPYNQINDLENQIDYSLSKSNENLCEIRIWINIERFQPQMLFELKTINTNTFLKKINYNFSKDKSSKFVLDSLKLDCQRVNFSVDSMINQINLLGFKDVYSQPDSLKGLMSDGITYVIEVKKDKYYKIVDCNSPQYYNDKNLKKLSSILNFLSKKIGFQFESHSK